MVRRCEEKESVSYYRRTGALTALLIKSDSHPTTPTIHHDLLHNLTGYRMRTCKDLKNKKNKTINCYCFDWNTSKCGELTEELKERGDEVLTPFLSFLQQGSQFPPDQSWFIGRGWGGGTLLSSHTSNVGREQNHKSSRDTAGSVALSPHCRSPPQTLARTGSRRARLTLPAPVCLLLFVCLFDFWGWGGARSDG